MPDFYNPYQFIPAKGLKDNDPGTLNRDEIQDGQTYARHDRWQKDCLSGKIYCTLTVNTQTLVGNTHNYNKNTKITHVEPYKLNNKIALPGNSIRGMVSSVCEIISDSALRVLENESYSVRKSADKALKAIGQVIKKDNNWYIVPLSVADFSSKNNNFECPVKWQKIFKKTNGDLLNWEDVLPIYINNGHSNFTKYTGLGEPLLGNKGYYIADNLNKTPLNSVYSPNNNCKIKNGQFLLGKKILESNIYLTKDKVSKPFKLVIIRQLELSGFHDDYPRAKKHALLIPYASSVVRKPISLSKGIVNNFEKIRKERYEKSKKQREIIGKEPFPIQIRGYRDHKKIKTIKQWKLLDGEIIYFDVDNKTSEVLEISTSAIWREPIKKSKHDFFRELENSKNILPLQDKNRTYLTPVETLFGVIESNTLHDKKDDDSLFSLAGRLRFSDAVFDNGEEQYNEENICPKEIILKRMAEPKPPCPALYFHKENGRYISKSNLNDDKLKIKPNGRKVFLRQTHQQNYNNSNDKKGCIQCKPIIPGEDGNPNQFKFTINFENLSEKELGLLYYSLKPDHYDKQEGNFFHLIGLGKPLGMGKISLDITKIEKNNRMNYYRCFKLRENKMEEISINSCFSKDWIKEESMRKLLQVGSTSINSSQVCYPKKTSDNNGYAWFVENDKNPGKNIGPVSDNIPKVTSN